MTARNEHERARISHKEVQCQLDQALVACHSCRHRRRADYSLCHMLGTGRNPYKLKSDRFSHRYILPPAQSRLAAQSPPSQSSPPPPPPPPPSPPKTTELIVYGYHVLHANISRHQLPSLTKSQKDLRSTLPGVVLKLRL